MDCRIRPITLKEKLEDSQRDLNSSLITLDTTRQYGEYGEAKRKLEYAKEIYDRKVSEGDTLLDNWKRNYDYRLSEVEKLRNEYLKAISLGKEIDSIINNSNEKELSIITQYRVYIDAYGKNSYGNSVLGKYYYTIDKTGETISEVEQFD